MRDVYALYYEMKIIYKLFLISRTRFIEAVSFPNAITSVNPILSRK